MINNKYTPIESLNRIQLMMNYNINKTLTENKQEILTTNNLTNIDDKFVFDLVISEGGGFLIFMDQVISKKHGFVGDLWENTWVFNEIIRESSDKFSKLVGESVENNLDSMLISVKWTKEFVFECLKESRNITEIDWDRAKRAGQKMLDTTKSGLSSAASFIGNSVLSMLRWIRRNIYTNIGMVIDIVTSMMPQTAMANQIAWFIIVALDIFEIHTGEVDPEDKERAQDPYSMLLMDLIAMIFTAGAGKLFRGWAKTTGKMSSQMTKFLKYILDNIPSIKNTIKRMSGFLSKHFPKVKNIMNSVMTGLDKVLYGLEQFIIKLLTTKLGWSALGMSGVFWYFSKWQRELKLNDSGEDAKAINEYIATKGNQRLYNHGCPELDTKIINKVKNSGNTFTKATEKYVKSLEACLSKKYPKIEVDGIIKADEFPMYMSAQIMDGPIERRPIIKYIPHKTKEEAEKVMIQAIEFSTSNLKNILSGIANEKYK